MYTKLWTFMCGVNFTTKTRTLEEWKVLEVK
jgi:hypothetical protein